MSDKKSDFTEYNLRLLYQTNINVDNKIEQIDASILAAFQDNQIWESIAKRTKQQLVDNLDVSNYFFQLLLNLYYRTPNAANINVYVDKADRLFVMDKYALGAYPGYIDPSFSFIMPFKADPAIDEWYAGAAANPTSLHLSYGQWSGMDRLRDEGGTFSLSRTLVNPFTYEEIMTLWFNIRTDSFQEIEQQVVAKDERFFVMTSDGELIYGSDRASAEEIEGISAALQQPKHGKEGYFDVGQSERSLALFSRSELTGWYLVKTIDYGTLMRDLKRQAWINTLIGIAFLFIGIVAIVLVSIKIAKPIHRLISVVDRVERDGLNVEIVTSGNDEIGKLGRKFKEMMQSINALISKEYKAKLKEREARIEALQTKINPHFLNNALQAISSIAIESDNERIERMVQALGSIMRYSLSKSYRMSTVREELDNVRSYLYIQKFRYEDRLDVEYFIDERTFDCELPPLIIQPIIENAIKHGIEPKIGKGMIRVTTAISNGTLLLSVSDNGVGIAPERLRELRENFERTDEENISGASGNGVINVHKRIEYLYGQEYGVTIESEQHGYTIVTITIPALERMRPDGDERG